MALTVKAPFPNLREVHDGLEAVEIGLGKLVADIGRKRLAPLLAEVRGLMPHDPTHRGWKGHDDTWNAKDDPGHIQESIRGRLSERGFTIFTTHPGGPVHWWGGSIRPRSSLIEIHHLAGAGEDFTSKTAEDVGRGIESDVDDLLRRHNL